MCVYVYTHFCSYTYIRADVHGYMCGRFWEARGIPTPQTIKVLLQRRSHSHKHFHPAPCAKGFTLWTCRFRTAEGIISCMMFAPSNYDDDYQNYYCCCHCYRYCCCCM